MKSHILLFISVLVLSHASCTTSVNTSRAKKPNIVFIYADDLGWKDVGFMGSKYYETPSIDALAASGMVFTNAYANAPNCAPSRAALMSGKYSPRTGIYTVGSSRRGKSKFRKLIPIKNKTVLDTSFVTIAEVLKQNGYTCASIGKWHLGEGELTGPLGQGFDLNIGGWHYGHPKSYFSPYGNPYLPDGPKGQYLTDRLTDEAIKFIKNNKDKPFFLYFPHYAVHTPLQAKDSLVQVFKGKKPAGGQHNPVYAAMVKSLDESVGRVVNELKDLGLLDNTIIFFTSDNGGFGPATTMAPLRGSKGMLYEGGIREPFIVSWKGKIKEGTKSDYPIIGTDMYPTVVSMTNSRLDKEVELDGVDLKKLFLEGSSPQPRALFWFFPAYLEKYRGMETLWRTTPAAAVRYGDFKLIRFFEDGEEELYNLKDDIGEKNDLADALPAKRAEMSKLLDEWIKSTNAPVPTERNPDFDEAAYEKKLEELKSK